MANENYTSEVLYEVRNVLVAIKDNSFKVTRALAQSEIARLKGSRAELVMNVAMIALGKGPMFASTYREGYVSMLVERAKQQNADIFAAMK